MTQIIEQKLEKLNDSVSCIAGALSDKHTTVAAGLHAVADAIQNVSVELSLIKAAIAKHDDNRTNAIK
ncbi:hypothetical protein ACFLQL_00450 [Verrucomicrobiota bacterium]